MVWGATPTWLSQVRLYRQLLSDLLGLVAAWFDSEQYNIGGAKFGGPLNYQKPYYFS
jgi:hypothetical protein